MRKTLDPHTTRRSLLNILQIGVVRIQQRSDLPQFTYIFDLLNPDSRRFYMSHLSDWNPSHQCTEWYNSTFDQHLNLFSADQIPVPLSRSICHT